MNNQSLPVWQTEEQTTMWMTAKTDERSTPIYAHGWTPTDQCGYRSSPHPSDKPRLLSRISRETPSLSNRLSSTHSTAPNSQTANGTMSSLEERLTWIKYSRPSSVAYKDKRLTNSAISRYSTGPYFQGNPSRHMGIGTLPGTSQSKRRHSCSLTETQNYEGTDNTSDDFFRLPLQRRISKSSCMTKPLEFASRRDEICTLLTSRNSPTYTCTGYSTGDQVPTLDQAQNPGESNVLEESGVNRAGGLTKTVVRTQRKTAADRIYALNAKATSTLHDHVRENRHERWLNKPKFARDLVWADDEPSRMSVGESSEHEPPVPEPPDAEYVRAAMYGTVQSRPDLFRIITPINVDRFEFLLATHPNKPFVESVCRGLREGFWPWAVPSDESRPSIINNGDRPFKDPSHAGLVREQCKIEVELGQLSPPFGTELLPGMQSVPVAMVPKPHSNKRRMVVDHSAEPFALNLLIPKHERTTRMDGMHQLGRALRRVRLKNPGTCLVMWKSDVSRAYRLIPMHPCWQAKQVVTIDGQHHVDHCNDFGGGSSGRIFIC